VIFSGGVVGTVELLLRLRSDPNGLPKLSPSIGDRVRTNSEVLIGVTTERRDLDLSEGVAITSILHTDDRSSLEPVRFSSGSGFFRLLATPHAPGRTLAQRLAGAAGRVLRAPVKSLRAILVPDWARYTTALMFMRVGEGYLRLTSGRRWLVGKKGGLRSVAGDGPLPTAAIPAATALADAYAHEVNGYVGSLVTETLLGIPTTAHILGGACMGTGPEDGVIDHRHRVFGYDGLFVIDGAAMSANPGVNPSLTITALAERAMSFIPEKAVEN
jgi:cholesterol oxidase